jgi:endoglucanase
LGWTNGFVTLTPVPNIIDQASVTAIKSWGSNIVRIPVNEQCWLGLNGVSTTYGGTNYKNAVKAYVDLLTTNGLAVIIDLHWTASGTNQASTQAPMPNSDHSVAFWTDCATMFKSYSNVIFDLFNEPFVGGGCQACTSDQLWTCWRDGGSACSGLSDISFTVAGMQTLINAVRSTGATNPVMLGGLSWSNALEKWLAYKPTDTLACPQIIASWHSYATNYHNTQSLWDSTVAPVAALVPVIVGEIGQYDCAYTYIAPLMAWLDAKEISYLAWSWNKADCGGPTLVTDYSGIPTNTGVGFKNHLATLNFTSSQTPIAQAPGSCPTPAPTPSTTTTTAGPTSATTTTTSGPTSANALTVTKVTGWNDYYIQISIVPNTAVVSVVAQYVANSATQTITLSPAPASWNVPQYIASPSVVMPNPVAVTFTVTLTGGSTQVYTLWNGTPPPTTTTTATTTTTTTTTTGAPTITTTTTTAAPTGSLVTTKSPTSQKTITPSPLEININSTKTNGAGSLMSSFGIVTALLVALLQ